MASAFEAAEGDLADRLVAALEAAEAAGGDIRGRQSSAMLIVEGERTAQPWQGRVLELRVEDHPAPNEELARLVRIHRAYHHMDLGDKAMERNDLAAALREYNTARELYPENAEVAFWSAVSLASVGRVEEARPLFAQAFADEADWRETLRRLPPSGLFPDDADLMERIMSIRAEGE